MASDVISPYITTTTLLFLLLLLLQTTASADKEFVRKTLKRKTMEFAARKYSLGSSNFGNTVQVQMQIIPPPAGPKRGRFEAARRRSPLMAAAASQDKIFNQTAHEVPSGPNPISNR